jgi:argininosuccinate synthase
MEKIALAYSGGLDTSVAIKLLQEKGYNVVTVTVDVGQRGDLKAIQAKAETLGVLRHYTIDAKKEFVEKFVHPAIKANALYQGKYPLSSALSRPLIATKLVEIAEKEGATAVAHGCTGKGNDQVRFEVTIKALNPDLRIVAPIRDWRWSREKSMKYAEKYNIPLPRARGKFSVDENLWGRSVECGPLEDPNVEPPSEAFQWTIDPEVAPNKPEHILIGFEGGVPTSLNGEKIDGVKMINMLNQVAGKHGIGRVDHVEDRVVGFKSREVYECPAATCLLEAHQDLEKLVLTPQQLRFKRLVDEEWARLVYTGLWVDALRENLETFIDSTQEMVTGEVKMKLFKARASVVGRASPYSLYNIDVATYDERSTFDQSTAKGFTQLWGLPSVLSKRRET